VETNVSQSAGSKASLAVVGRMAPSHAMGFQKRSRALALSACSSRLSISTRRAEPWTGCWNCKLSDGDANGNLLPFVWTGVCVYYCVCLLLQDRVRGGDKACNEFENAKKNNVGRKWRKRQKMIRVRLLGPAPPAWATVVEFGGG
jgi:hypothetical protein